MNDRIHTKISYNDKCYKNENTVMGTMVTVKEEIE